MCNLGFVYVKVKAPNGEKSLGGNKPECAKVKETVSLREEIGQPEKRGRKKPKKSSGEKGTFPL